MITLADIYLLSGGIGFVYIMGTTAMGFANTSNSGDAGGGDAGGGDAGGGDAGGGDAGGGDAGGGDAGGDAGGGDAGSGDAGGGDAGGGDAGGGDAGGADAALMRTAGGFRAGLIAKSKNRRTTNYSILLLKIISPSTLTTFGFFFGLSGALMLHLWPWMDKISLAPATVFGIVGYNMVSALTSTLAARMHVSTSFHERELIGSTAEVSVSIPGGGMGEITYVANGVRTNAPAKAIDKLLAFRQPARVIIIDIKDGIMIVERCPDELLRLTD